jgi:hypothetical protein
MHAGASQSEINHIFASLPVIARSLAMTAAKDKRYFASRSLKAPAAISAAARGSTCSSKSNLGW